MEKKEWPELVQDDLIEAGVKEFQCDYLKVQTSTEKTALYTSLSKMTESIDEFTLSGEAFEKANSNDINPVIYIRVNKGYKPKKEMPKFDINAYYKKQEYFGMRFVLSPDF